jgi:hypothetical protein
MMPGFSEMDKNEVESLDESDYPENKVDLPPEYCQYKDQGCDLANSCLKCPFPQCVYEQPRGRQRWLKKVRDREITRMFTSEEKGVKELALIFDVSSRTVQRALKNTLSKGDRSGDE